MRRAIRCSCSPCPPESSFAELHTGLADALRIGLRARLLQLMGVDDPAADRSDSESPPS